MLHGTPEVLLHIDRLRKLWVLTCLRCDASVSFALGNGLLATRVAEAHADSCDGGLLITDAAVLSLVVGGGVSVP